jgi:hypothetical protein
MIINDLRIDMRAATEDIEPRTLARTNHRLPDSLLAPGKLLILFLSIH